MKTYSTLSKGDVLITTNCVIETCQLMDNGFKKVQQVQVESKSVAKAIWALKSKQQEQLDDYPKHKGNKKVYGVVASIMTAAIICLHYAA